MNKTTILALLSLALIGIVAASASASFFGWGADESIRTAIDNNDYASWKTAIEERLTEENFNLLVARHQQNSARQESRHMMRDAIGSGDYDSYVETVNSISNVEPMSEEDFNTLVELHNSREGPMHQGMHSRRGFFMEG